VQVGCGLGALGVTEGNLRGRFVAIIFLGAAEVSFTFSFFN
jgi:hypothetical protein